MALIDSVPDIRDKLVSPIAITTRTAVQLRQDTQQGLDSSLFTRFLQITCRMCGLLRLFPRVAARRNHGIGLISTCNWLMSRSGKLPSRFESGL
jgi:hypothetical protein